MKKAALGIRGAKSIRGADNWVTPYSQEEAYEYDNDDNDDAALIMPKHNPDLDELEFRLNHEVDSDFFMEPSKFHTTHRVIDVLGAQLLDTTTTTGTTTNPNQSNNGRTDPETLRKNNPAYKALKKQQQVVEEAIEHIAIVHCADMNKSVVHVGRVSRQFQETSSKVKSLRKQVQDIKETLGTSSTSTLSNNNNSNATTTTTTTTLQGGGGGGDLTSSAPLLHSEAQAAAMSLRELWLKKLECEAVLALLEKMEVVRAAPAEFDAYIRPRSLSTTGQHQHQHQQVRIGAAVVTLARAFDIAFNSHITYVPALQNVSQQITNRKQVADQIIWETLYQVLYLRTGNGAISVDSLKTGEVPIAATTTTTTTANASTSITPNLNSSSGAGGAGGAITTASVDSKLARTTTTSTTKMAGLKNPFLHRHMKFANDVEDDNYWDEDDEDQYSLSSQTSSSSFFSRESGSSSKLISSSTTTNDWKKYTRIMIPITLLEAELDLEQDELRCLEQYSGFNPTTNYWQDEEGRMLPKYHDHVLALRILVECLAQLGRLDDVDRTLHETLESELRKLAQAEQARTFMRLERGNVKRRGVQDLKDFRRHLRGILSLFGCVMVRLSHLAQILRHRITTEKGLVLPSYPNPNSAMHSVLASAYEMMNAEIKDFLRACLLETEKKESDTNESFNTNLTSHERGFFSLGITNDSSKKDAGFGSLAALRARNMKLPADKFVVSVLFPKTNTSADVRHALEFRKALAHWTAENESLKKELGLVTGEDTSTPSYKMKGDETALDFLDGVIKRQLIPILQDDALKGTTSALEREDAFDPVIDHTLYGKNSNEPQDVEMCIACQALYFSTASLFQALHRLPQDEKMYLHLVGVLEHAILTFTSRVTPRVQRICSDKMAFRLLVDTGTEGKDKSFNAVIERRHAFTQLLRAYADGDLLEASKPVVEDGEMGKDSVLPLSPPSTDTIPRNTSSDKAPSASDLDLVGNIEREEQIFADEVVSLQSLLDFTKDNNAIRVCSDEELMKASCLAHSLLKLSSLLESRLKIRSSSGFEKPLPSTRALKEAIKSIRNHGIKMAKFCRIDFLMQSVTRLSKICRSSTIVAKDAVRIPSCVNDLGEYLTAASDNLREAGGNALTAYTFSSLEQYIPFALMQTVRVIASGGGIIAKLALTLNGVEAMDRSGSVLYRDLKGATGFDNSFWDDELAAISFERSASFMAMMELEMEELEAYYRANHEDFSEGDFQLMFAMNGPRRRGDIGRYNLMKRKIHAS